ncbi:hydrogenase [Arcobacteraceae bacterium]|nr:hydrogenase [Arcobacteraceae bacterium]
MAIVQKIQYNSENKYFAGFLQNMIDESALHARVEQKKNEIVLTLDEKDEKALVTFSELTTKFLPHSLFLGEITTARVDTEIEPLEFKSDNYEISLCRRCIENLQDPSSESYLDDNLICNHYNNTPLENEVDNNTFTPNYSEGSTLLVVDPTKINDLFIITKDEYRALFSIEKPTIKVTIKDQELKELTGKQFINIKSTYNMKSTLTAINAKDSELSYIFFNDLNPSKIVIVQKNISIIRDNKFSKKLENLDEDRVLNRFLNIVNETPKPELAIAANLSVKNGISFIVKTEVASKKAITFQDFHLETVLLEMLNDPIRNKLIRNYAKKFPDKYENLKSGNYDIFGTLCVILDLEETSFESLSDKALEFHGNGGLKIDMNFKDSGFDYSSLLGSVISFKIADVDTHYLAYSVFEAYGDMIISTLNQLKTKFKIDNFVMMGDMFENSIIYSRILSKFQLSKPFFSKDIAFDE